MEEGHEVTKVQVLVLPFLYWILEQRDFLRNFDESKNDLLDYQENPGRQKRIQKNDQ